MSLFRLPMNLVVVVVLVWSSAWPTKHVFWVCAGCQLGAFVAYQIFLSLPPASETVIEKQLERPLIESKAAGKRRESIHQQLDEGATSSESASKSAQTANETIVEKKTETMVEQCLEQCRQAIVEVATESKA